MYNIIYDAVTLGAPLQRHPSLAILASEDPLRPHDPAAAAAGGGGEGSGEGDGADPFSNFDFCNPKWRPD